MNDDTTPFEVDRTQLVWRGAGEILVVEPWGEDSARVRSAIKADVLDADWALLTPLPIQPVIEVVGHRATLTVGRLSVVLTAEETHGHKSGVSEHRCRLQFFNQHGDLLLSEIDSGGALDLGARQLRPRLGGDVQLTAGFAADPTEKLFGMGLYQQDIFDLKGSVLELAHRNSQSSVPFVLSSKGYGFLWHNPAIGRATFATNRTEWFAESTKQLDYWVTAGDTPAKITRAYAEATGFAPMMPESGLGFWQCRLRYWNQEQLLAVAREHKRRGLPIDVIVADFFHWPKMGDFRFEDEFWPDPSAMVAELRELGIELMVSVWPQISLESENYVEMKRRNLLVRSERGIDVQMAFGGPSTFFDATDPRAREFVWNACARNYGTHGVRLFWLDEAEPEYGVYDFDNYRYRAGTSLQVGNLYPQAYSRGFYEGQRGAGQTDIVNLVRAAWAGSQRFGALVWSGDISSTFDHLRRQITAGLQMGIAGIPWFTTDIGGFGGGDATEPEFRELLTRWFQFGAFSPVMRLHGDRVPAEPVVASDGTARMPSGAPNELWSFGDETYRVLKKYVDLRELMRPYLREVMRDAHKNGQPVMRALFHEFPDDEGAWTVSDQYLLGRDLLVAPVVEAGARARRVYLPEGETWTSATTGQVSRGGRLIDVDAPLDVIPVFLRGGQPSQLVGRI